MTELKQKLEKRFEKWLRKYLLCNDCKKKCTCVQLNAYCEEQVKQAYIAGVTELQEIMKKDLASKLKELISYSTSPSCTKGMELFIKGIEDLEFAE